MAKENPWFKFEPAEWMFGRIQRQTPELKGVFIDLICKYWHRQCEMSVLDAELDFGKENIDVLFSKGIIHNNNDESYISISFLDEQMDGIKETSKKNSENGLKSVEARKKQRPFNDRSTTVQRNLTDKKREDKKREDKITIPTEKEFIDYAVIQVANINTQDVSLKYRAWKEGGWKTGGDKPKHIKNWKTTLLNTIPHMRRTQKQPIG